MSSGFYETKVNPHRWMFWRRWDWVNRIREEDGRPAWSDVPSCDEVLFEGKSSVIVSEGHYEIAPEALRRLGGPKTLARINRVGSLRSMATPKHPRRRAGTGTGGTQSATGQSGTSRPVERRERP